MLTHQTPIRPSGIYGASKVWGEALARHYADTTDLSIICLRIGHVTEEDRPLMLATMRSGAVSATLPVWSS